MNFLSLLFGKKPQATQKLNHPSSLNKGDIITIDNSFALPAQLRGQQLQVEAINCYEYEHNNLTQWQLKGHTSEPIFLSLKTDDVEHLCFGIKLNRAQIEQMFDMEQFAELFEEPGKAELLLLSHCRANMPELTNWLADKYYQITFAQFGYFHRQDYRTKNPPQEAGEPFEHYRLESADETQAIDIEVYENGDTDIMLILNRPLTDIREYWSTISQ